MLRIGVDATCWANGRGYGRFAREVVRGMAAAAPHHRFHCYGDAAAFAAFPLDAPNILRIVVPLSTPPMDAAAADDYRSPIDLWRLTRAVHRDAPDVFFSPSVYAYFPLPPGLRTVVTVHDAIVERFPALTLPNARARLFWRLKMALALRQARLILTVSDYAARDITRMHGVAPARLRVAVEAPAAAYAPADDGAVRTAAAAAGLPPDAAWFTYVGGFSPHKHVDVILRALAEVPEAHLLLIGRLTGDAFLTMRAALESLVQELGLADRVHWTGFLPDPSVAALHSGAIATLLPSASEGFGLPAVEAAACGTPVVATLESPLPELLAGGGRFVTPGVVAPLVEAMEALRTDPVERARAAAAALTGARALTWERTARATLAAIEEAAA